MIDAPTRATREHLPPHGSRRWRHRRRAPRATGLLIFFGLVVSLTACAPTISVPVAPHATDPLCATAILAAPSTLVQQPAAKTTSQASAAWGDRGAAITLRCGVSQPEVAADNCVAVTDDSGQEYDWIAERTTTGWQFTTYGRTPALQVELPATLGLSQPTAPLVDLAPAARPLPVHQRCHSASTDG